MEGKINVFIRTRKRTEVLRDIKEGMRRGEEIDNINKEILRQGNWNFRYGLKGLMV